MIRDLILGGLATYIPGRPFDHVVTGGTNTARYCYSVWLRHLVKAHERGLNHDPRIIAELGPGDSIGTGLAGLLCGAEKYFAFDVIAYANLETNIKIFDEMISLLQQKQDIPGEDEFPGVYPKLSSYQFPSAILTDARLSRCLEKSRLNSFRFSLQNCTASDSRIKYVAPWDSASLIEKDTVDMIFSQAVMEHVNDLPFTYKALHQWLKPGGFMSHQIDFRCHGTAEKWNGHWSYSDILWKLIRGRRPYLINREPCSTHLSLLERENFKIVNTIRISMESDLTRCDLARRFRNMSDEDQNTSGVFVQAIKPA